MCVTSDWWVRHFVCGEDVAPQTPARARVAGEVALALCEDKASAMSPLMAVLLAKDCLVNCSKIDSMHPSSSPQGELQSNIDSEINMPDIPGNFPRTESRTPS